MPDVGQRLFLFDLDDTIYDRTPHRFGFALMRVGPNRVLECFKRDELLGHIESIRILSPMFERLGFPSTRDRTNRPLFIAGMLLAFGSATEIEERWRIPSATLSSARRLVEKFSALLRRGPARNWMDYLVDELESHQIMFGSGVEEAKSVVDCLLADPDVIELADQTADTVPWECRQGFRSLWSFLQESGVSCCIASEGEEDLQREKLAHLGLGVEYSRVLCTSERVSSPLDTREFVRVTDCHFSGVAAQEVQRIPRIAESVREGDLRPERMLSVFGTTVSRYAAARWFLSTCARKTPSYYSRVIHACVAQPDDPTLALDAFERVTDAEWKLLKVGVAMCGNYHAKDIVPIQQLLGSDGVWTGLLDLGAHRGIRTRDAAFFPSRMFSSWDQAVQEIRAGIRWRGVERTPTVCHKLEPSVKRLLAGLANDPALKVTARLAELARLELARSVKRRLP